MIQVNIRFKDMECDVCNKKATTIHYYSHLLGSTTRILCDDHAKMISKGKI